MPGKRTGLAFFSSARADRNFSRCPRSGSSFPSLFLFSPLFLSLATYGAYSIREQGEGENAVFAVLVLSFFLSLSPSVRIDLQTTRLFSHAFHVMFFLLFHRLKLDCEKLANDKIEIQRHYVMVSAITAS